jgi:hypothetical protein
MCVGAITSCERVENDPFHLKCERSAVENTQSRIWSWANQRESLHTFGSRAESRTLPQLAPPYCTTENYPEMQVLLPPLHGAVSLTKGKNLPAFCKNQIDGVVLFYNPAANFVGQDQFIVRRKADWRSNGRDKDYTFVITVREGIIKPSGNSDGAAGGTCVPVGS